MIVLITPTGARPGQFDLCQFFMQRQTYSGKVVWIIIDDANPVSTAKVTDTFKPNWTIMKIYPKPVWLPGQNTQGRNIEAGINAVKVNFNLADVEAIFIIEDDDYYRPQYLERMMARFQHVKVLGEMNTVYYNVYYRNYFINRNTSHVSLFQLAFRPEMIPLFASCYRERFIDFKFFEKLHSNMYVHRGEVGLFNESNLALGMKGMPGRAGIGAGHGRLMNMLPDPQMLFLIKQIQGDSELYTKYYGRRDPHHDILSHKRYR
jgi:hypothetical protein